MPIFRHRRRPHLPPPPPKPEIAFVRAGCSVRISVRVTDGGVALDWNDPNLDLKDVRIWSDARRGLIGRPLWEVDSDDPTILRATYDTSAADLPGLHRLWADFSYNGWSAAHCVPAYCLVPSVFCSKGEKVAVKECGCGPDIDVRIVLHDVSTTYLQSLIDLMLSLCEGENERITVLEAAAERLRADVDTNSAAIAEHAERLDGLDGRVSELEDCCGEVRSGISSLEKAVAANTDGISGLDGRVGTLEECCSGVKKSIDDILKRIEEMEEQIEGLERADVTIRITPVPSHATVVINGIVTDALTVSSGTYVSWSVSAEGYETGTGSLTLTEDTEITVELVRSDAVYGDLVIDSLGYDDIPASGGESAPKLEYHQTWGYGQDTGGGVITSGAQASWSGVTDSDSGSCSAPSLGTEERERSLVATASVVLALNGRSAEAQCGVYQEENRIEGWSDLMWAVWSGERDFYYTSSQTAVVVLGNDAVQKATYTSGEASWPYADFRGESLEEAAPCDWAYTCGTNVYMEANDSYEERGPYEVRETCESNGESIERTLRFYQYGKEITEGWVTFAINAVPADATVFLRAIPVIGTAVGSSGTGHHSCGTYAGGTVEWEVSREGCKTQSGSQAVYEDTVMEINLVSEND